MYASIGVMYRTLGVEKVVFIRQKSRRNITEAMHILKRMPAFQDQRESEDYQLYFWAIDVLVQNPIKIDIFCALPTNSERMEWLATEHEAEILRCRTSDASPSLRDPPLCFPPPPCLNILGIEICVMATVVPLIASSVLFKQLVLVCFKET